MNSTLISKVEKARRYAEEPERVRFQAFEVAFEGDHADYVVSMEGSEFKDSSPFFQSHGTSAHIMAMQRLLAPMLTDEQRTAGIPFTFSQSNSTTISKIDKARRYADEPERVKFRAFRATMRGGHGDHNVSMDGDTFTCSCHFFESHGTCSHVMAMQRILADMLTDEQQTAGKPFSFSAT